MQRKKDKLKVANNFGGKARVKGTGHKVQGTRKKQEIRLKIHVVYTNNLIPGSASVQREAQSVQRETCSIPQMTSFAKRSRC